jgi:hypothetical protein
VSARRAVVCLAACGLGASTAAPWLDVGLGLRGHTYAGTQLPILAVATICAAALMLVAALAGGRAMHLATLAGASAAVVTGLMIFLVEVAGALIPASLLPTTVRRVSVEPGAGPGLWAAFALSVAGALAASGYGARLGDAVSRLRRCERPRLTTAALTVLGLATVLFWWLRYQPWIDASGAGQQLGIEGSSTPWVGPLSLVALWLMIGALAGVLLAGGETGALLAGGAAWLATFVAAVAIIAVEALGHVAHLHVRALRGVHPSFSVTPAVWAAFAAGMLIAAAAAALLAFAPTTAEGRWAR